MTTFVYGYIHISGYVCEHTGRRFFNLTSPERLRSFLMFCNNMRPTRAAERQRNRAGTSAAARLFSVSEAKGAERQHVPRERHIGEISAAAPTVCAHICITQLIWSIYTAAYYCCKGKSVKYLEILKKIQEVGFQWWGQYIIIFLLQI